MSSHDIPDKPLDDRSLLGCTALYLAQVPPQPGLPRELWSAARLLTFLGFPDTIYIGPTQSLVAIDSLHFTGDEHTREFFVDPVSLDIIVYHNLLPGHFVIRNDRSGLAAEHHPTPGAQHSIHLLRNALSKQTGHDHLDPRWTTAISGPAISLSVDPASQTEPDKSFITFTSRTGLSPYLGFDLPYSIEVHTIGGLPYIRTQNLPASMRPNLTAFLNGKTRPTIPGEPDLYQDAVYVQDLMDFLNRHNSLG